MVLVGDDDGCLEVAEGLDLLESSRVFAEIDDVVLDALAVQRAVRCGALYAGRLGVYRDCHVCFLRVGARRPEMWLVGSRYKRVPCPRAIAPPNKEYYPL